MSKCYSVRLLFSYAMLTVPPIESLTMNELDELNFQLVNALVRVNTAIRERNTGELGSRFHGITFDCASRTVFWPGGGKSFSRRAIRRFLLLRELLLSESGVVPGQEIGQNIWGNECVPWDNIRKLAENTDRDLEESDCILRIEVEDEQVKLLER